jgi:hypothetical protein
MMWEWDGAEEFRSQPLLLSQPGDQQHRRRGMQRACSGINDQHHADIAEVSDCVGANGKSERVEPTSSVCLLQLEEQQDW